jgi:hypothetical protein
MTALETFTNSFQATLDHGAPSRHGRYGGAGLGGVLGLVLVILIVLWLAGALSGHVGPTP